MPVVERAFYPGARYRDLFMVILPLKLVLSPRLWIDWVSLFGDYVGFVSPIFLSKMTSLTHNLHGHAPENRQPADQQQGSVLRQTIRVDRAVLHH